MNQTLNPVKAPAPVYRVYHGWTVRPSKDVVDFQTDFKKVPPTSVFTAGIYYYFSLDDALQHLHELHDFYVNVNGVIEDTWYEYSMRPHHIQTSMEKSGRFRKLYYRRALEEAKSDWDDEEQVHHRIRLSVTRMSVCLAGDRSRYMDEMDFASNHPEEY